MPERHEHDLPDDLRHVGERLRAERHRPGAVELDGLKRRAMTQASRTAVTPQGRSRSRSRVLALLLVLGLLGGSGATGVLAGKKSSSSKSPSAASSEYKCNSGIGNGPEGPPDPPATPPSPDCDPGNSPPNNATNQCEGPVKIQPPECKPAPQPKPAKSTTTTRRPR